MSVSRQTRHLLSIYLQVEKLAKTLNQDFQVFLAETGVVDDAYKKMVAKYSYKKYAWFTVR